jgi:DNA methylase
MFGGAFGASFSGDLAFLAQRRALAEVAATRGMASRWVQQLARRYNERGAEALGDLRCGNGTQARILTPELLEKLKARLADDRHREFAMASGGDGAPGVRRLQSRLDEAGGRLSRRRRLVLDRHRLAQHRHHLGRRTRPRPGPINLIVWSKSNAGQGSLWRSAHELYPMFKKGKAPHVNNVALGRHGRWRSNVWTYPGGSSLGSDSRDGLELHPTVKPRAMLEDALFDVTNRGDIVIDCFCGSGSMVLAAEATGRRCRAIEIDGLYFDVTIKRWQAMTGRDAILESTGETFARVAEARSRAVSAIPNAEGGA